MNMAILSLVFLFLAIGLGFFRKTNMGLVAFGLALVLGKIAGLPVKQIQSGFPTGLFVTLLGVMLMFSIGMELNIEKIKKYGKIAFIVAVIQLPLMVLSGYFFGMILFGLNATASITLGAVISGSSTAVVAAVLKTHERITKEAADTLVLVTIMEDIGQVIILSMVTPLFLGSSISAVEMVRLIILIIVFIVRSLPTGTRSGISALRQIDKSIEESAYDMGANSAQVFTSVTLPLIKDSFLSGLVTAFVRSITAISAVILLVTPEFLLITCQINEQAEKGNYGVACAYATVLICITYSAVLIMNWIIKRFGTSRAFVEEEA